MRSFLSAVGVFTILPAKVIDLDRSVTPRLIRLFPLIGLLLGGLAAAVTWGVGVLSLNWLLAIVLGLATLALLTGALHLDGLADTADGIGSRKPADEALVIMRKSDVGPMGVAALVFVVLLQIVALLDLTLNTLLAAMVLGPFVGRTACLIATGRAVKCARTSGFGALFAQVTPRPVAWLAALFCIGIAVATGIWLGWNGGDLHTPFLQLFELGYGIEYGIGVATALGISVIVALIAGRLLTWWFTRRLGGLTGDTFGAIIEVTTLVFWLVLGILV